MVKRRKSYRLPEEKYNRLKKKLAEQGLELSFDEFLDKSLELYLQGKIDPKNETDDWGRWMKT